MICHINNGIVRFLRKSRWSKSIGEKSSRTHAEIGVRVAHAVAQYQTVNELAIVPRNTFKNTQKKCSSSDITFRYLIESRWCGRGSNESRLSANEIVMKSVPTLGICGDGMTTSTRSSTGRKILFRNLYDVAAPTFRCYFPTISWLKLVIHERNSMARWVRNGAENLKHSNNSELSLRKFW